MKHYTKVGSTFRSATNKKTGYTIDTLKNGKEENIKRLHSFGKPKRRDDLEEFAIRSFSRIHRNDLHRKCTLF